MQDTARGHSDKVHKSTSPTHMTQFQMLSSVTYCVSERQQSSGSFPSGSEGRDVGAEDKPVTKAWKPHDVPGNSGAEKMVYLMMMQSGGMCVW